jgi:hypothetical protein
MFRESKVFMAIHRVGTLRGAACAVSVKLSLRAEKMADSIFLAPAV